MQSTPKPVPDIPTETFVSARKVYNAQHIYLRIGDQLENILVKVDLSLLNPCPDEANDTALRLALITAFQYAELLSDQAASEATLRRMDWKYALYLPLQHPGISTFALCEFRHNLFARPLALREFSRLLAQLGDMGLYTRIEKVSLEPIKTISSICQITRLSRLNQAMKTALSVLVAVDPDWLRANARPHWYERYKTGRLAAPIQSGLPSAVDEANQLGVDMYQLLHALQQSNAPHLNNLIEIRYLAQLWEEQYQKNGTEITWQLPGCADCTCNHLGEFNI